MDLLDEINSEDLKLLIQIHHGHTEANDPVEDDSSSDESSDCYKPPLYTFEELTANLVESSEFTYKDNDVVTKTIPSPNADLIAQKLNSLITPAYCNLCRRVGGQHYSAKPHIIKILTFIRKEYRGALPERRIVCVPCKTVLTSMKAENHHFSSTDHHKKAQNFCYTCYKCFPPIRVHLATPKHHAKLAKENVYLFVALVLGTQITHKYCFICNKYDEKHYEDPLHNSKVLRWVQKWCSCKILSKLYCDSCNLTLPSTDIRKAHYQTDGHLKRKSNCSDATVDCRKPAESGSASSFENTLGTLQNREMDVEARLFLELKKLVDAVYLSKSVPFDKSIVELRDLNRKMEVLRQSFQSTCH